MKTDAIRIHRTGGPEVLQWEAVEVGGPGPGQVLVRHTAIGLNFVDVMMRRGLTAQVSSLPLTLGRGGAGRVEAVGEDVQDWKRGDRVAYAPYTGSYCEYRLIDADKLVRIPDSVDDRIAGASILQGLTAHYLIRQIHAAKAGDVLLVHAAAGGVGIILCQWAAALGAIVIGTVSTPEKAALARAHGCQHVILYNEGDFTRRVAELTSGRKADVVYDSVGANTFLKSLDCLRPGGRLVSYGASSGPVPPLDVELLGRKGALTLTKGTLLAFTEGMGQLQRMSAEWFDALERGLVKVAVNQTYALRDAHQAHRDLEERRTTGSTVLLP